MKTFSQLALICAVVALTSIAAHAQNGSLKVNSFPAGAAVSVDGVATRSVTPASINLPVGVHTVTIAAGAGWNAQTHTVTVAPGINELNVTLVPTLTAGPAGLPGPKGDTGAQGPQGIQGIQGIQGPIGPTGPQGDQGKPGPEGPEGKPGPQGEQGERGPIGEPGAQGATGPVGPTGPTGANGAAGLIGPTGATGPTGPPGTGVAVPPEAPPPNYGGTFYLMVGNSFPISLTGFGGCFDKQVGIEYEDCYFETPVFMPELIDWFHDSVSGADVERSLTVVQVNSSSTVTAQMTFSGFMREFAISDFDATEGKNPVTASFIVVPSGINTVYANGGLLPNPHPQLALAANFRLTVDGTPLPATLSLAGMRLTWPKVLTLPQIGARKVFSPGFEPPVSDPITLTVVQSGSTATYLNSWFAGVVNGNEPPRTATLESLNSTLTTVLRTFTIHGLQPVQFLPFSTTPSGTIATRSMTIYTTAFQIQ